jgi:hypothetical protein
MNKKNPNTQYMFQTNVEFRSKTTKQQQQQKTYIHRRTALLLYFSNISLVFRISTN